MSGDRCNRFEAEGTFQIERGEPLDAHYEECADCREARRKHKAIIRAISLMEQPAAPRAGWESAVMATIDRLEGSEAVRREWCQHLLAPSHGAPDGADAPRTRNPRRRKRHAGLYTEHEEMGSAEADATKALTSREADDAQSGRTRRPKIVR